MGFPSGSDSEESACNARCPGLIHGLGRSPGEGNCKPLQCSCLENPMDTGAWQAAAHKVTQSDTTEATQDTCTHKHKDLIMKKNAASFNGQFYKMHLKTFNVIKSKGNLRNCHSQRETRRPDDKMYGILDRIQDHRKDTW